ncbi:13803_t:CDS:2 [Funneliformis caledonium]|uniref:13803_t:CDS:1 n=1 Tax=Funneliformis caledonium TaxID=1117310 RepID=A0A9N9B7T5_9GLOM|nr:13803_t:CDS:2 [Funneliformis caledonium]
MSYPKPTIKESQKEFIRTIFLKILSHPFRKTNSSLMLLCSKDHHYDHIDIDNLLRGAFNKFDLRQNENSIYINYQRNTLKNILPVCEKWFQSLKNNNKLKVRRELNFRNLEEQDLVNDIGEILPAFYFIGLEQDYNLIFGSDYGIYITIKTRHNDMKEANNHSAENKHINDAIRVLRASYINDRNLEFEDEQDEEIARLIQNDHEKANDCDINLGAPDIADVEISKGTWIID